MRRLLQVRGRLSEEAYVFVGSVIDDFCMVGSSMNGMLFIWHYLSKRWDHPWLNRKIHGEFPCPDLSPSYLCSP